MGGGARKRSFDETGGRPSQHRQNEDMTKRSHKKQKRNPSTEDQSSKNESATMTNNRPGLQFASHKLNSSVKLADLRDLVLYCMADGVAPSWISVQNKSQFQKVVILLVPGLELGMFDGSLPLASQSAGNDSSKTNTGTTEPKDAEKDQQNGEWTTVSRSKTVQPDDYLPTRLDPEMLAEPLKPLANIFANLWPIKTPGDQRFSKVHSPLHTMLQKAVQETSEEKNKRKQANTKGAKPVKVKDDFNSRKTPLPEFIATAEELRDNSYVIHPAMLQDEAEKQRELARRKQISAFESATWKDSVVDSKPEDSKNGTALASSGITDGRNVYAVDCEMCVVGENDYALTRISVLSWDGATVFDELVKPEKPITNYLTQYSGISEDMLKDVTTTLEQIQERLLKLFNVNTILVGHSLDSDLKALKFTHPYIVDTSIIYPHPRGPPMKSSLKWLCQKYLAREIQKGHGSKGHNSVEDAKACLDLVRLKCEKGKQWGTPDATNESIFKLLGRKQRSGQPSGVTDSRQGAIVDLGSPERNFGSQAAYSIGCKDDNGIVDAVKRCVLGDPDGAYVPGGGVELTWARLRELDYLRGWANNNRHEDSATINKEPSTEGLAAGVARTVSRIKTIHDFLPPCTLLIVYSGTGDPRALGKLQEQERQFKKEYQIKKWDELSVKWTDDEAQALKKACDVARSGLGLMCVT